MRCLICNNNLFEISLLTTGEIEKGEDESVSYSSPSPPIVDTIFCNRCHVLYYCKERGWFISNYEYTTLKWDEENGLIFKTKEEAGSPSLPNRLPPKRASSASLARLIKSLTQEELDELLKRM
jgi:hypothetical protein